MAFFGTDGSVKTYKDNINGIVLEVSIKDKDSILKLESLLSNSSISYRERNTNFKDNYKTIILHCYDKEVLQYLMDNHFPLKDKTILIDTPSKEYDEQYF